MGTICKGTISSCGQDLGGQEVNPRPEASDGVSHSTPRPAGLLGVQIPEPRVG